jgi:hypothetical protein
MLLNNGMSENRQNALSGRRTNRTWHRLPKEESVKGLAGFGHYGNACRLSDV